MCVLIKQDYLTEPIAQVVSPERGRAPHDSELE